MTKSIDLSTTLLGLPPLPSHSSESISTLLWAREVLQQHLTSTYAVKDPKGIEELKSVKIGGVDQWLHIRGRNRSNPVLLYLHGGPGYPTIGLMDAVQRPWEDYFTIVNWDQRQTGKSYYPADDENAPLTVQQFIEDTEEVIQYLRDYLEKDKLFILASSWGTVLGMHMVKRHPDWVHAYIGAGQLVNWMENEKTMYERLLSHAKEQKNAEVIAKLEAITPYPDPNCPETSYIENAAYLRRELSRLAGEAGTHHLFWDDSGKVFNFDRTISPHLSLTDISNFILTENAATRAPYIFTKELMATDLPNDVGSSFEVPIFFFTGAHDWHTPRSLSDQWFSEINAPYKELIHFDESSHGVLNEEPGKALIALVNKVLPFAPAETKQESRKDNGSL